LLQAFSLNFGEKGEGRGEGKRIAQMFVLKKREWPRAGVRGKINGDEF
jgi:hypothetical protein